MKKLLVLLSFTLSVGASADQYSCKRPTHHYSDSPLTQSLFCEVYNLASMSPAPQTLPDFDALDPIGSFRLPIMDVNPTNYLESFPYFPTGLKFLKENYGIVCEGYLNVPEKDNYTLFMTSDDGVRLSLDHKIFLADDSVHAPRTVQATKLLKKGLHSLRLEYFQGPRYLIALKLEWQRQDVDCKADKNLLVNGNLDQGSNATGLIFGQKLSNVTSWDVFRTIPGWYTESGGAGIEIQKAGIYDIVPPTPGRYVVELDSAPDSVSSQTDIKMSQQINLESGSYALQLDYLPRTTAVNDSRFQIMVDDKVISEQTSVDTSAWHHIDVPVSISKTGHHKISFKEIGTENGTGSLIHNVTLTEDCVSSREVISKRHLMGLKSKYETDTQN